MGPDDLQVQDRGGGQAPVEDAGGLRLGMLEQGEEDLITVQRPLRLQVVDDASPGVVPVVTGFDLERLTAGNLPTGVFGKLQGGAFQEGVAGEGVSYGELDHSAGNEHTEAGAHHAGKACNE